jgi:dTDP-4-amino-4,6-dideoxygalactose transaminase
MRLEISWSDLAWGLCCCIGGRTSAEAVERQWSAEDDALACLSVRSGFDLLIEALDLPAGSEVLISAITIPDMVRILERHGLVPVPVDLRQSDLAPQSDVLRNAVTPRTRAIIVTHLFGGRVSMEPIFRLAGRYDLAVIEDCAQAYVGPDYRGDPRSLAAMFSFGTIKTATALGGALLRVSDAAILGEMRSRQAGYPRQTRGKFLRRLLKYAVLKALTPRAIFAALVGTCRRLGIDHNRAITNTARGFARADLFEQIRRRPSVPLLALLGRRLRRFDPSRLKHRADQGERLAQLIGPRASRPGAKMDRHTHWVFPILTEEPGTSVVVLAAAGFDATRAERLCVVDPPEDRPELDPATARMILAHSVFLPCTSTMPSGTLTRLADVVAALCGSPRDKAMDPSRMDPREVPEYAAPSPAMADRESDSKPRELSRR